MVTITINGQAVEAPEGTSVLDAATAAGVTIPTLCYLKDLNCIGSCRVCLVDVEGEGLAASCNTAVREGMRVRTDTPQVAAARRRTCKPSWTIIGRCAPRACARTPAPCAILPVPST